MSEQSKQFPEQNEDSLRRTKKSLFQVKMYNKTKTI